MPADINDLVGSTKQALIEAIFRILGKDGENIANKISNASNTPEGLRAVISQCEKITKLTFDKNKFESLKAICSALLVDLDNAANSLSSGEDNTQQERKIRMVKAKLITIASKVLGTGVDGRKITEKLRNAPESYEGLQGSLSECEKLASLTIDPKKVKILKLNCEKVLEELT